MSLKKEFWNQKILSWERSKYKSISYGIDVNSSVKHRLHLTASLLQQISEGKHLLELGSGSGRFYEHINSLNLASYKGLDFSETAIKAFQNKIQNLPYRDKISLFCEDCVQNIYPADIVISLGLLDWLDMKTIEKIAENYKNSWFLHSFSEKRKSLSQAAHSVYSLINYRQKNYFPRYRKADELLSVFGSKANIYRDPKNLSFGAFIYHLPIGVQFKC